MMGSELEDIIAIPAERVLKSCSMAMKAHKSGKSYTVDKHQTFVVFCFAGTWSLDDWFAQRPFGETKIDLGLFPSLKSIGTDEVVVVNEAFQKKFKETLPSLQTEVDKALRDKKQVYFTGHSSGAPIAMLAALYFLEKHPKSNSSQMPPRCITFGSPLLGDSILSHSAERENWSQHFVHFVMRNDIVPRISLAPLSYMQELPEILEFFNPKSKRFGHESFKSARVTSIFYKNVMRNTSSVTSHAASKLKGCTNLLLETLTSFTELSPYRPFGIYVFCTGNGKLVIARNTDAILQLLFYSAQLSCDSKAECGEVAYRSLREHLGYESELHESLQMQSIIVLENLEKLPLSSDAGVTNVNINMALNDLGLSTSARLCLRAAGELEKQKVRNQVKIDKKMSSIEENLSKLQSYRAMCEVRKVSYYDSFRQSNDEKDFHANINRLELAGIWDEIIEMLKRNELPDGFESRDVWIELGTRYRRMVEPLDIANYYRHTKNEDTGPYLGKGRPKRYRFTQRWREHALKMAVGSSFESCFWAEVEELRIIWPEEENLRTKSFEDIMERVLRLENETVKWVGANELGREVFLQGSTFAKWWNTLPQHHRSRSRIKKFRE